VQGGGIGVDQQHQQLRRFATRPLGAILEAMTETRQRILELFETLAPAERRELVEQLAERSEEGAGFGRLTPEQIAKLDEGIAQAERGDTVPAEEAFDRLAQRFGFSNA
jgi:hypothetical protein